MLVSLNETIAGIGGKEIVYDIFIPESPKGLVLFVHGFKGFKDFGAFGLMEKHFSDRGLVFCRMNFSHNGTSLQKPKDFCDLDAFGKNRYSYEKAEIGIMIQYLKNSDALNKLPITLIGHSRGGSMALVYASAEDSELDGLISWSAPADLAHRFPKDSSWKEKGVSYIHNGRTKQEMPLNYSFYQDFLENRASLNPLECAHEIKVPTLIIHAEGDETVDAQNARNLQNLIPNAELHLIPGSGHTFDTKHPWNVNEQFPTAFKEVLSSSLSFIEKNCTN